MRYLPPGGNKIPSVLSYPRIHLRFSCNCRRSLCESKDWSIRRHKSPVRFLSDLSVTVREIVIHIWSLRIFPTLFFRSVSQWTLYGFFSIPLKARSTIGHVRPAIHSFHFKPKLIAFSSTGESLNLG